MLVGVAGESEEVAAEGFGPGLVLGVLVGFELFHPRLVVEVEGCEFLLLPVGGVASECVGFLLRWGVAGLYTGHGVLLCRLAALKCAMSSGVMRQRPLRFVAARRCSAIARRTARSVMPSRSAACVVLTTSDLSLRGLPVLQLLGFQWRKFAR